MISQHNINNCINVRIRRKHGHCASFHESFVPRRVLRSFQGSHDVNGGTSFDQIALFTHLYCNASIYRTGKGGERYERALKRKG